MGIFKAYDIRGIYPQEINEDIAYKIGFSFVSLFSPKKILVGRDMRESSPSLYKSLTKGITDAGCDIVYAGMVDTPMFYFCAREFEAAIMVTASHNPGKYNGFKMCGLDVRPITYDNGLNKIEEMVQKSNNKDNNFKDNNFTKKANKTGKIVEIDFMPKFVEFHLELAKKIKPLKIVVDAANGMGGITFSKVFEKLNCDFTCLYQNPDGNFPNHEANPMKEENLKAIKKEVIAKKADLGIALDGDADRCMFIDEKGDTIGADLITTLIAKKLIEDNPKSIILYDLRSSRIVQEIVEKEGGIANMCRVGHSYIKEQMRKEDAIFAGELSAHLYFKENHFAESPLMATFAILELMSETNKKLSELVNPLRKYFHSGEINFEVKDKNEKMQELERLFYEGKISHLDGIRIDFEDWWFNVRASNTEPVLRLNLEATTKEKMEQMKDKLSKIITN